jgi:hypothetical protein
MKNLRTALRSQRFAEFLKSTLVLVFGLALAFAFWTATAAKAKEITPIEMIQSKLPQAKTLATATKPEVLSAICGAVGKWRNDAPEIVRTATGARKEMTGDIVAKGIRCLGEQSDGNSVAAGPNCDLVGQIVNAGLGVNPEQASNIIDLAVQLAPDCREAVESAGTPAEGPGGLSNAPSNLNPPPGSLGVGAGKLDPQKSAVTICDNGQNVQVPASHKKSYMGAHPGSRLGACQTTPSVNK